MADKEKKSSNIVGKGIVTPRARLSYPYLEKPDEGREFSDGKFKVTLLFPKEGSDFAVMKNALLAVAQEKWGKDTLLKDLDLIPFKNGDDHPDWSGYADHIFLTAKSKFPVMCIGPTRVNGQWPMIQAKDCYAGCYVRAIVAPCAFMRGQDRGVTFLLNSVQFLEDGPRFGGLGVVDAGDMFGEWDGAKAGSDPEKEADTAPEPETTSAAPATGTKKRGRPVKPAEPATEAAEAGNGVDDDALPLSGAAKRKPAGNSLVDMI